MGEEPGGEIMDASLNVVANVNARDADPVLVDALTKSRRSKLLRRYSYRSQDNYGGTAQNSITHNSDSLVNADDMSDSQSFDSRPSKKYSIIFGSIMTRNHHT